MTDQPYHCAQCGIQFSAPTGMLSFFQLSKEPNAASAGSLWRFCTYPCLAAFVKGGDDA